MSYDGFHVKSRTFKKSCSRFPILLLRSNHLSGRTLWTCLVLGGVHPTGRSSHLKNGNFSKNARDTQLWTIISRDLLSRFGRQYAYWKAQIVYFLLKIWKLEFTVFSRFWDDDNIRYAISFVGLLIQQGAYGGLNHPLLNFTKHPSKVCTLSGFSQKKKFLDFEPCKIVIFLDFCKFSWFLLIQRVLNMILIWRLIENRQCD